MRRLIDEDNVIRIVEFECGKWTGLAKTIINSIKKIPCSATDTNVGDTIYRQAAIDAFEDTTYTKNEIHRRITELPSAQPERKTGHWIKWGNRVKCDQCALTNKYSKPFCPNCGARMVQEGEDNDS